MVEVIRPERSDPIAWRAWVAYCLEHSPEAFLATKPKLGKPMLAPTWCPECSSLLSETFNWSGVYLFNSKGPRIKCVQCLAEWFGRHGIP